jgi:hypothetical protein
MSFFVAAGLIFRDPGDVSEPTLDLARTGLLESDRREMRCLNT